MLNITQSQRIDLLLASLQDFLASQQVGVFDTQQVIVPSHGVGLWLRYQLASKQGVSAQISTDFFGSYQWRLYRQVLGGQVPGTAPFARPVMQWRLFAYLLTVLENPVEHAQDIEKLASLLAPLRAKFKQGQVANKQCQRLLWRMSEQIAQVFANYVLYRADWLEQWSVGKSLNPQINKTEQSASWLSERFAQLESWQHHLWQRLFATDFIRYQAISANFWQAIESYTDAERKRALPAYLAVFTVLQLAPAELKFLERLASYCTILFLHFNPSQEYWADSVDAFWLQQQKIHDPIKAASYESRHPLLTRLGKQARENFAQLVYLSGNDSGEWQDLFPNQLPQYFAKTVLGQLQKDILYLADCKSPTHPLQPDDRSIQIHACHSTLRQLEVLRDELIQWFSEDHRRQPCDVVVFVPNLAEVAPLIHTVFAEQADCYLPYEVTGVAQPQAEQLWQAMQGRYTLLDGRFSLEEFLDWLSLEPVQQLYQLNREQVQRLAELLQEAGFRRGFDAQHLQHSLHPADRDNRFTLQFALNRLMLGIAMPVNAVHQGILSYTEVGRSDFELIACLYGIYHDLSKRRADLNQQGHSVQHWLEVLRIELKADFSEPGQDTAVKGIEAALNELEQCLKIAQEQPLSLPLRFVLDEMSQMIAQAPPGSVPTGKITFSRLGTLRPLPYQLVVMLNLDNGVFPSPEHKNTFDLIALGYHRLGDRSRQTDEKGAFLDGLILAQQACWLFYNGFSSSDSQPRLPSSVLQELINLLEKILLPSPASTQPTMSHIVRQHSLEPFEPVNFASRSASFNHTWLQVATRLSQEPAHYVWQDVTLSRQPVSTLSWPRIVQQLCKPAQHFLNQSRVRVHRRQTLASSFEPLILNKLEEYSIRALHHQQEQLAFEHLQGMLPVSKAATAYWSKSQLEDQQRRQRLAAYGEQITPLSEYVLSIEPWQIKIRIPEHPDIARWLEQQPASPKGKRQLQYWLEHLAWQVYRQTTHEQAASNDGQRVVLLRKGAYIYQPLPAELARQELFKWLEVWQQAASQPWVLPPDLALSGNGVTFDKKSQTVSIKNSQELMKDWLGEGFANGVAHVDNEACQLHPEWQLVLRGQDVTQLFLQHLQQHALTLYQPLQQYCEVKKD